MTEEVPHNSKDDYGFSESYFEELVADGGEIVPEGDIYDYPDVFFRRLEDYRINSSKYCLVQGALYDWLKEDCRPSEQEAMNTAQLLNRGQVKQAESFVEEVLEDG